MGYVKSKVFKNRFHNILDLKARIRVAVREIDSSMLEAVAESFRRHLRECIELTGRCLQSVVF